MPPGVIPKPVRYRHQESHLAIQADRSQVGIPAMLAGPAGDQAADAIADLAGNPPAKARVVPLAVAGAFHTRYMAPAVERVAPVAAAATVHDPALPIWTNADGSRVDDGRRFVDLMVQQIASPVHWDAVMESFSTAGVTGIIELAPAGALVGLAKRGLRGTPTVAIKTPDDLPAAIELLQAAKTEAEATA